jgi:hypothetical protein
MREAGDAPNVPEPDQRPTDDILKPELELVHVTEAGAGDPASPLLVQTRSCVRRQALGYAMAASVYCVILAATLPYMAKIHPPTMPR